MVVYINTNSAFVLMVIAVNFVYFPILIMFNIGICIYHNIELQIFSLMWDRALQNGQHHHPLCSNDVVRSVASSPAIRNGTNTDS